MSARQPALLAHHFDTIEQQREAATLGMWTFLATELLFFGVLFTGYSVYRVLHPHEFEVASHHLNVLIGALNTVVLLTSSLTMALAVHATHTDRQRMLVVCLILTALLGTLFLVFKGIEYYTDYRDNLVPGTTHFHDDEWLELGADPRTVALFYMIYYIMTGVHAVHLTIGIGVLVWLIVLAWRERFSSERYTPVEISGLYWHFVDIIWIFLLPLLYLISTHSVSDFHF